MCTRETNSKDVMTIITWQRWQWLNQTFWMNMVYIENFQTKKKILLKMIVIRCDGDDDDSNSSNYRR